MKWIKTKIDEESVIYSNGIVAFIMKSVPNADFLIGETPVTQILWQAIEKKNPSHFADKPFRPVDSVSFDEAKLFIAHLNEATGERFRLPTAQEWEFAAKCGQKNYPYKYPGTSSFEEVDGTDLRGTYVVKKFKPNEIGLYCMVGNVLEWTDSTIRVPADDVERIKLSRGAKPEDVKMVTDRILKGGSWINGKCTSAIADIVHYNGGEHYFHVGFRLVIDK